MMLSPLRPVAGAAPPPPPAALGRAVSGAAPGLAVAGTTPRCSSAWVTTTGGRAGHVGTAGSSDASATEDESSVGEEGTWEGSSNSTPEGRTDGAGGWGGVR